MTTKRPAISTGLGDKGITMLMGGKRVPKHHLRVEAYGTIDELNSFIGWLRSLSPVNKDQLKWIQARLLDLGAWLSTDPSSLSKISLPPFPHSFISTLEKWSLEIENQLPPLRNFILPGGNDPVVSLAHVCRTVCRRAERLCTNLNELEPIPIPAIPFLNRLSDYLFLLARLIAIHQGISEEIWVPDKNTATP